MPLLRRKAFGFLLLFFSCYVLLLVLLPHHRISLISAHRPYLQTSNSVVLEESCRKAVSFDRCRGRKVYLYDLPEELNRGLLEKCNNGLVSWLDFCRHLQNDGFGEAIDGAAGWYGTDAYMLEIIFHSRIRSYSCLTNDASEADAFFVPYYAGLDALRYLYKGEADQPQHQHGNKLVDWLESQARNEWKKWGGKDHFMVMGRTSWDFAVAPGWGTRILELPHIANMTTLYLERNPWAENQVAVPYPTSFHPSNATQLQRWLNRVRTAQRSYLFAFAGGIRPTMVESIRGILLKQCEGTEACVHVDCGQLKCGHDPRPSVEKFVQSKFCLQPRGDTPTRRSAFDALISGCIPVFFHQDSAYSQFLWHLPADPRSYSVFIPEESVKGDGGVEVEAVLGAFLDEEIEKMRSKIVSLIPGLIYRAAFEDDGQAPDAFDITLSRVLEMIEDMKKIRV